MLGRRVRAAFIVPSTGQLAQYFRVANLAGFAVIVLIAAYWILRPWENDGMTYWRAWSVGLYDRPWLEYGAFVYSPAFAQLIWPLTLLPFAAFWAILVAVQAGALMAVVRPTGAALLLVIPWLPFADWPNPAMGSLGNGNVMILLGAAVAFGLRYPALWAFVLLTKITPGIGLLWFAVRREWRNLAIALGTTTAIAAVSFLIDPHLWVEWISTLTGATGSNGLAMETYLPLTLGQRLLLAVPLIVWGARTGRRWTVPLASMLALPAIALGGFCVGLGALYWLGREPVTKVEIGVRA